MGSFSYAIPFLIGVLLIGSLNSNLFSGSRYMYAAAKQGHLPSCFSCVNIIEESPRVAVFTQVNKKKSAYKYKILTFYKFKN